MCFVSVFSLLQLVLRNVAAGGQRHGGNSEVEKWADRAEAIAVSRSAFFNGDKTTLKRVVYEKNKGLHAC